MIHCTFPDSLIKSLMEREWRSLNIYEEHFVSCEAQQLFLAKITVLDSSSTDSQLLALAHS